MITLADPKVLEVAKAQMHKHFQEVAAFSYKNNPDVENRMDLDFTISKDGIEFGYEDELVNALWAGYQFSTLMIRDGKLVGTHLLAERYLVGVAV